MTLTRAVQVTFDAADPAALGAFWCEVLGYQVAPPPPEFGTWDEALDAWDVLPHERNLRSAAVPSDSDGPRLFFQRMPESEAAKDWVHLDVRTAPALKGADRLTALQTVSDRLITLGP